MEKRDFEEYLHSIGFNEIPVNQMEFSVYAKAENRYVNVIQLVDYQMTYYIAHDLIDEIKRIVEEAFKQYNAQIHAMTMILFDDLNKAKALAGEDPFCWLINRDTKELIIEENRTPDFYGMKSQIQYFLDHYEELKQKNEEQVITQRQESQSVGKRVFQYLKNAPKITLILVIMNIAIYIACCFTGNTLYQMGELSLADIFNGEYYRLVTAMFLHGGMDHIFGNMLLLYFVGEMLEKVLKKFDFTLLYFLAGISGNVVSCLYDYQTRIPRVSYGASGAVYGLFGALLCLVLMRNKELRISLSRIVFLIAYAVYSSFAGENINAEAHIGGLLSGLLITWLICLVRKHGGNKVES